MASVIVTKRDGSELRIEGDGEQSIMEALRNNGVDELIALCGGCCSCATCHVYVDDEHFGRLPAMSDDENDLLDSSDFRKATSRLSCQLSFSDAIDGLRLAIAPEE